MLRGAKLSAHCRPPHHFRRRQKASSTGRKIFAAEPRALLFGILYQDRTEHRLQSSVGRCPTDVAPQVPRCTGWPSRSGCLFSNRLLAAFLQDSTPAKRKIVRDRASVIPAIEKALLPTAQLHNSTPRRNYGRSETDLREPVPRNLLFNENSFSRPDTSLSQVATMGYSPPPRADHDQNSASLQPALSACPAA